MDITIILNAHSEGSLAHPTILSVERSRFRAHEDGLTTEVIVVLDSADADTIEQFQVHGGSDWRLEFVNFSDIGKARNYGVSRARGRYISFLDGDDLFSANWLTLAARSAKAHFDSTIWHPELNIYFGAQERIFYHRDMEEAPWQNADIIASNQWTALAFASTEYLRSVPHPDSDLPNQIGYEDWGWNERAIGNGSMHKIVHGTAHLIRVKRVNSLLMKSNALRSIPSPSGRLLDSL